MLRESSFSDFKSLSQTLYHPMLDISKVVVEKSEQGCKLHLGTARGNIDTGFEYQRPNIKETLEITNNKNISFGDFSSNLTNFKKILLENEIPVTVLLVDEAQVCFILLNLQ